VARRPAQTQGCVGMYYTPAPQAIKNIIVHTGNSRGEEHRTANGGKNKVEPLPDTPCFISLEYVSGMERPCFFPQCRLAEHRRRTALPAKRPPVHYTS